MSSRTINIILSVIFSLWISVLPLLSWDGVYEGPKVFWFLVGGVGLLIFWIHRILFKREIFSLTKIDLFFLLWIIILLLASIFGVHPFLSIIGGSYRRQGVIFFLLLWLVGKTAQILDSDQKKFLIRSVGLVVLIESVLVAIQFLSGRLYFGKPLGTLGEANAVAGFLAVGSFFVFESFPKLLLILPVSTILITQSRAGILAIMSMFAYLIGSFSSFTKKALWIFITLSVTVLMVYLTLQKGNSPFENRGMIWKLAFNQIFQKPILGFGAESGEVVYNIAFKNIGMPLYNLMVDRSHNLLIDVAMWSGIVGLAVFCVWLMLGFKNLKDTPRRFAFLSLLIYAFLQPLSIVHWILLFLIL